MEMLHNAIAWFEIPVLDFERAQGFYSKIYDYEMPEMQMGPARMGFLLSDSAKGGIGGAIVHASEGYVPSKLGHKIYLNGGKNLNVVLDRVAGAGGQLGIPKTLIAPEMGYYASFWDTEGNEVHLHSME
jgi:uncharacterized protein